MARALAADPPLLLMDEPFGAIDPINRERLQNEFLRLQAELRKTIVFVTHDIDEAIKMGDRIAVLKEGGHLAQYAPPAELLMTRPTSSSRTSSAPTARSSASRSSACATSTCGRSPLVRLGEPVAEARAKLDDADLDIPLVVDDDGRPLGWLSERGLPGERVREELPLRRRADHRARRRPARRARRTCCARDALRAGRRRRRPRGRRAVDRGDLARAAASRAEDGAERDRARRQEA